MNIEKLLLLKGHVAWASGDSDYVISADDLKEALEGYAIVPREPTEAMLEEACARWMFGPASEYAMAQHIYKAMIAASDKPQLYQFGESTIETEGAPFERVPGAAQFGDIKDEEG